MYSVYTGAFIISAQENAIFGMHFLIQTTCILSLEAVFRGSHDNSNISYEKKNNTFILIISYEIKCETIGNRFIIKEGNVPIINICLVLCIIGLIEP